MFLLIRLHDANIWMWVQLNWEKPFTLLWLGETNLTTLAIKRVITILHAIRCVCWGDGVSNKQSYLILLNCSKIECTFSSLRYQFPLQTGAVAGVSVDAAILLGSPTHQSVSLQHNAAVAYVIPQLEIRPAQFYPTVHFLHDCMYDWLI